MSITTKGTALLNPGTTDETWGLCKNITENSEGEKEEIKRGDGEVVSLLYTDIRKKVKGTYVPLAAASSTDPPKMSANDIVGSPLTLNAPGGTVTILVDSAEKSGTQGGAPAFSVEGRTYSQITSGGSVTSGGSGGAGN